MPSKIFRISIAVLILSQFCVFAPVSKARADSDSGRIALFDVKISPDGEKIAFGRSGDIWIADINSGKCSRVTDNVAYDHSPAWFPNSDKIAFSSDRDGNDDVYSVPLSGDNAGEPTRHTWFGEADIALDVAPDGEHILFRSSRGLFSIDLYEVDIFGGLERPLTNDTSRNFEASSFADGKSIVVSRGIFDWTRRGYHGSGDTDLYVMDRDGKNMRWIENGYDGKDCFPVVSGDYIYFVSDRDFKNENIFRIPSVGGKAERITSFHDRAVQWLSISNTGRTCFVRDFKINIMDSPGSSPRIIDIDCPSEPKHNEEIREDISGEVTEMALSPKGTHLAVIARGELYVIPLHDPKDPAPLGDQRYWEAVRITDTPYREQYVSWNPSGDKVALSSDKDGNSELYEIDLRTKEWKRLTNSPQDEVMPKYSPDGKKLAYYRGNDELVLMDFETGKSRVIARDLFIFLPWIGPYEWSGDGKYIAYTGNDRVYYGEVYIVDTQTENPPPVNITVHHDHDFLGGWAPDGKSIYFLSRRNFEVGLEGYGWWWQGGALFSIPLINLQPPTSDILFPENEEDKETGTADETRTIDFDKIDERAWQVTNLRGGGERAAISPDGKTYVFESNALGNWAIWSVPFESGASKKIVDLQGRADDIEWLPDGRGFLYMSGNKINFLEESSGAVMPVPLNGRFTVNLADERREMVREATRIMKNNFYDEKMHGYDWDEIERIYEPLIADASVGEEYTLLMQMMLGEINASHLGAWTHGSNEGIGFHQAELGLEFDSTTTGSGLLVKYVLPRGPADYDESRVETGEWVLSIDETPVSASMNYRELLDNAVATSVVLTVASDQSGSNSRKVKIVPIDRYQSNMYRPSWSEAEYEAWVDRNASVVDKLSGGRVGYVHIRWMNGGMLERFTRDLFAKNADKDALIIDIRWNPGGNIHEYLLDILSRQRFGWSQPRDGERISQPAHNWGKPTVLLINERSSSDSEIFPSGFRALNLGTIIGETTLGAVIGTESYTLIDGSSGIRLPIEGWYSKDGTNLENYGVPPDIRVVNDLNDIRDGIDNQLEYAVKYLIDNLGK